ncbi:Por secretion system C-terminal sorting domain-containing protein [Bacteroides luti]|uniref:Por secretion system C-terminal sorting domain-containing protein n=1 Tax=Bacteroides luti TaxID=1297750 RepID=A0A1M5CJP5_9BACE|nr:alpha-amylase family glycosyl hydrolase [Bacteroides luti]SHF54642.1 Por secretion system C-terminal sorting domain-containing protein [Bacteroides luti]
MKKLYSFFFFLILILPLSAQIVTTTPAFPIQNAAVTIVFDATQGTQGLKDYTGDVYAHTGVITDKSTSSSDWKYAPTWGNNSSKYKLTSLGNNKWQLSITPDIRSYYGVPAGETIKKMVFVFRSSDNSKEGKDTGSKDIFVDVHEAGLTVRFDTPSTSPVVVNNGQSLSMTASSSTAATLKLFVDGTQIASQSNATSISATHSFTTVGTSTVIVSAESGTVTVSDTITVNVLGTTENATLPAGAKPGINYNSDTEATLVLQAPNKNTVYVIGDFNDWKLVPQYQLKKDGEYFWIKLTGLTVGQEYAFQYVVDGSIYIADPYADKLLDPWNDSYIPSSVYPNLKKYPTGKAEGIVSVLQTGQAAYNWQVSNFTGPNKDQLIVYEMLVRDFTSEHTFKAAQEKVSYIKSLGVNAVELMPINEFDGNSSWGYNPSFYFAVDKYYGTKNDMKAFVDECHKQGLAVIIDMVLNHSYGQSPFYKLYADADGTPSANNPWYNKTSNISNPSLSWGYDFNHESTYTRALVDSVAGYWMNEYKVDGFRYDFTKGFSNTIHGTDDNWANRYDAARIANLKRMASEVWKRKSGAYVICEHLAETSEESELGSAGIMLWRNMNNAYCQTAMGFSTEGSFTGLYAGTSSMPAGSLVGYMESHDEERTSYKALTWGDGTIKTDLSVRMKQAATNAAFFLTVPGPKMIWQFGELGYDISIDYNGRVGEKPVLWNYYDDTARKGLYDVYSKLAKLRKSYPDLISSNSTFSWQVETTNWTNGRFITIESADKQKHLVVVGNFTSTDKNLTVTFPHSGLWYNYITDVPSPVSTSQVIMVPAHEFKIFTDFSTLSSGINDIISSPKEVSNVYIYSVNGILINKLKSASELDNISLEKGCYIVRTQYTDGTFSSTKVMK